MFTGIVTDIGKIIELEKRGDLRARIQTDYDINTIAIGASIACDGICLTVIKTGSNWFELVPIGANWFELVQTGSNWF